MLMMRLFKVLHLDFRSKQSELGKSLCNANKIRAVLPVKWLISYDKFDMNYLSTGIILVMSMIRLSKMFKLAHTIDSIQAWEGS